MPVSEQLHPHRTPTPLAYTTLNPKPYENSVNRWTALVTFDAPHSDLKFWCSVPKGIDFLFLDGMPREYLPYLQAAERSLRAGAVIVADNAGVFKVPSNPYPLPFCTPPLPQTLYSLCFRWRLHVLSAFHNDIRMHASSAGYCFLALVQTHENSQLYAMFGLTKHRTQFWPFRQPTW